MVERWRLRHLLLLSMAVALTAHLWMQHDSMHGGLRDVVPAAQRSTANAGLWTPPQPQGEDDRVPMPFMALTCLAVVICAFSLRFGAAPARRGGTGQHNRHAHRLLRRHRPLGWPPAVPPPSRIDGGVVLLV